jgi:transcription elongation GreA/GreB family factor
MALPPKRALKEELVAVLQAQLAEAERAYQATREAATHEEAKPENDKDTRALEQSYVARGQAMRIEEMRIALAELDALPVAPFAVGGPAAIGALVTIEENEVRRSYYLTTAGGGIALSEGAVQVVTIKSPLGRALLGKRSGDGCEARIGDRTRELDVIDVH